jgi:transposase InsO family protein
MLTQFKNELAAEGPPSADKLAKIEDRRRLAALDLDAFLTAQSHGGTAQGLVAAFCHKRGIPEAELTDRSREWLVQLIHAAHAAAIKATLDHIGILISMSGRGNCYDNSMVETFFKIIKSELIWPVAWQSRQQAENAVARYIDGFYNPVRRHSSLGFQSAIAFERKVREVS